MNQSSEFFLQWNTNSLVSHWGQFKNYMLHNKPLIAAIQETHFLDSDTINYNFNIRDYSLYTNNINKTSGVAEPRCIFPTNFYTTKLTSTPPSTQSESKPKLHNWTLLSSQSTFPPPIP